MSLPPAVRGAANGLLLGLNTLVGFSLMVLPALVKLLVPAERVRAGCDRLLNAVAAMGEQFESMLDVTIVYARGAPSFWDLLCGRLEAVTVEVRQRAIPPPLLAAGALGDKAHRQRVRDWIESQWAEKDQRIARLLQEQETHVA